MALSNHQLESLLNDSSRLPAFIEFLKRSDYSTAKIREHLGLKSTTIEELLSTTARLSMFLSPQLKTETGTLSTLILLFLFSADVDRGRYESGVPDDIRELLESLSLIDVNPDRGRVKSRVTVVEFHSHYFVSDNLFNNFDGAISEEAGDSHGGSTDSSQLLTRASEHVAMPVHASSLELFTRRRPMPGIGAQLDVGCGTGVLSVAGTHAPVRVGIDLNPRCILFSKINAYINSADVSFEVADAITWRHSRRFDYILFNSPFIPQPDARHFSFQERVDVGESLAIRFVNANVEHLLAPEGLCQIWTILPVPRSLGSVSAILRKSIERLEDRFAIAIETIDDSKFRVPARNIAQGRIPSSCYLAFPSVEPLKAFIQANDLVEIAVVVLNVRHAGSQ